MDTAEAFMARSSQFGEMQTELFQAVWSRLTQPQGLADHPWLEAPPISEISTSNLPLLDALRPLMGKRMLELISHRAALLLSEDQRDLAQGLSLELNAHSEEVERWRADLRDQLEVELDRYRTRKQAQKRRHMSGEFKESEVEARARVEELSRAIDSLYVDTYLFLLPLAEGEALLGFIPSSQGSLLRRQWEGLVAGILDDLQYFSGQFRLKAPELHGDIHRYDWPDLYRQVVERFSLLAHQLRLRHTGLEEQLKMALERNPALELRGGLLRGSEGPAMAAPWGTELPDGILVAARSSFDGLRTNGDSTGVLFAQDTLPLPEWLDGRVTRLSRSEIQTLLERGLAAPTDTLLLEPSARESVAPLLAATPNRPATLFISADATAGLEESTLIALTIAARHHPQGLQVRAIYRIRYGDVEADLFA